MTVETRFKRIERKFIVPKGILGELLEDLKEYLVEDDYPTSTITNIYYDTQDFQVIKDALAHRYGSKKIRLRTYQNQPCQNQEAFLEIKEKDAQGIGFKSRLVANPTSIDQLLTKGITHADITDSELISHIQSLRALYTDLQARMYIYYDRYALKQLDSQDIRLTIDYNLIYRDHKVSLVGGKSGHDLLDPDYVIMEVKIPNHIPDWLSAILDRYGLTEMKFSKYAAAYHQSQGLAYSPRPAVIA